MILLRAHLADLLFEPNKKGGHWPYFYWRYFVGVSSRGP